MTSLPTHDHTHPQENYQLFYSIYQDIPTFRNNVHLLLDLRSPNPSPQAAQTKALALCSWELSRQVHLNHGGLAASFSEEIVFELGSTVNPMSETACHVFWRHRDRSWNLATIEWTSDKHKHKEDFGRMKQRALWNVQDDFDDLPLPLSTTVAKHRLRNLIVLSTGSVPPECSDALASHAEHAEHQIPDLTIDDVFIAYLRRPSIFSQEVFNTVLKLLRKGKVNIIQLRDDLLKQHQDATIHYDEVGLPYKHLHYVFNETTRGPLRWYLQDSEQDFAGASSRQSRSVRKTTGCDDATWHKLKSKYDHTGGSLKDDVNVFELTVRTGWTEEKVQRWFKAHKEALERPNTSREDGWRRPPQVAGISINNLGANSRPEHSTSHTLHQNYTHGHLHRRILPQEQHPDGLPNVGYSEYYGYGNPNAVAEAFKTHQYQSQTYNNWGTQDFMAQPSFHGQPNYCDPSHPTGQAGQVPAYWSGQEWANQGSQGGQVWADQGGPQSNMPGPSSLHGLGGMSAHSGQTHPNPHPGQHLHPQGAAQAPHPGQYPHHQQAADAPHPVRPHGYHQGQAHPPGPPQ